MSEATKLTENFIQILNQIIIQTITPWQELLALWSNSFLTNQQIDVIF